MRRKNNAFTLIEILVVVILVGIMAAIVIPQFTDASTEAEASQGAMNLAIVQNAVDYFHHNTGGFPASVAALTTSDPPYLREVPQGTWAIATDGTVTGP